MRRVCRGWQFSSQDLFKNFILAPEKNPVPVRQPNTSSPYFISHLIKILGIPGLVRVLFN